MLDPRSNEERQEAINTLSAVSIGMWLSVLGTFGILFLPLFVGGIISDLGFSDQQGGYIAAAEMAGVAIASGSGVLWVRKVNWRVASAVSLVLLIATNYLSVHIDSFAPMFVVRLMEGLASGVLLAIGMACLSDHKEADRIFGYWVAGQMTMSVIGYLVLPTVRESWGLDGLFIALALLGLISLLFSYLYLPARGVNRVEAVSKGKNRLMFNAFALVGALLFFMAQGGIWAFLEKIGASANLNVTQIGYALALSSFFGIAGGFARNWIAQALGQFSPFIAVLIGEFLMLVIFLGDFNYPFFMAAVCMLQFFWAMGMASFLGSFNIIDKTGGLVLLLLATAKVGYSLGPAIMGTLVQSGNDYDYAFYSGGAFALFGIVIVMGLIKTAGRES